MEEMKRSELKALSVVIIGLAISGRSRSSD